MVLYYNMGMIRKAIIDSILKQADADQSFENEALATFVEGEVINKLLDMLNEQDIQKLEKMKEAEIAQYLSDKIPEFDQIIIEEVQKAKEKFGAKKQPVV